MFLKQKWFQEQVGINSGYEQWMIYQSWIVTFIICSMELIERFEHCIWKTNEYRPVMEQTRNNSFHMDWSTDDECRAYQCMIGHGLKSVVEICYKVLN